jgi:hypothetical protein
LLSQPFPSSHSSCSFSSCYCLYSLKREGTRVSTPITTVPSIAPIMVQFIMQTILCLYQS